MIEFNLKHINSSPYMMTSGKQYRSYQTEENETPTFKNFTYFGGELNRFKEINLDDQAAD